MDLSEGARRALDQPICLRSRVGRAAARVLSPASALSKSPACAAEKALRSTACESALGSAVLRTEAAAEATGGMKSDGGGATVMATAARQAAARLRRAR